MFRLKQLLVRASVWTLGLFAASIAISAWAGADEREFAFTYSWQQAARGEHELGYDLLYSRKDRTWQHWFEYEYGITDRFSIAPYVTFEQAPGDPLHFDEFKLEARYRLGDYAPNRVLPGLYLEYEKATDEAAELEYKLILSVYRGRDSVASFNYVGTQTLRTGRFDHGYTFGMSWSLPKRMAPRVGFEVVHDLTQSTARIGPVAGFHPGPGAWIVGGIGLPLGGGGSEVRVHAQYQWF